MLISMNGRVFILKFPFLLSTNDSVVWFRLYQWTVNSWVHFLLVLWKSWTLAMIIMTRYVLAFTWSVSWTTSQIKNVRVPPYTWIRIRNILVPRWLTKILLTDLLRELLSIGFLMASWFKLIRCRIHDPVLLCHNSEAYFCMHVLNKGEKSCILL